LFRVAQVNPPLLEVIAGPRPRAAARWVISAETPCRPAAGSEDGTEQEQPFRGPGEPRGGITARAIEAVKDLEVQRR
jgi:hypothetical protein